MRKTADVSRSHRPKGEVVWDKVVMSVSVKQNQGEGVGGRVNYTL